MLRAPATIEEQLQLKAINDETPFDNLPKRLQALLNSKEEWHRRVIEHCLKKRLLWNNCFARKLCKEAEYYEDMMRYLRKNLALFPYHLAEYVIRVMRISPFRYYCDILFEVMKNEQPYDSIPNFSAADALRITGVGRNEFIDIMNKCRSKKIMWKLNKSIAKELLPTQPVDFRIEPWWGVCLVNFTLEEFKKLSEEELATIDKICKEEANSFVLFDPEIIRGLFRRGLVYFDIPVYPDDRFKVSRLEGFVSNREQSYEDPIEELLYAVFVVSSENSTVTELATTLQAQLSQLQAAASFACRLGWAEKIIDPASILQDSNAPGSPKSLLGEVDNSDSGIGSANNNIDGNDQQGDVAWAENNKLASGYNRVAFVVDANITSYLMMGSVSPGLKSHAVTLYEAGKLGHASIADLCKDLGTLEGAKFEGELQEFANHAFSLRCVLECLTSGGVISEVKESTGSASLSNEVANSLMDDRLEDSVTKEFEPPSDESMQLKMLKGDVDSAEAVTGDECNDITSPGESADAISMEGDPTSQTHSQKDENTVSTEGADDGNTVSVEGADDGNTVSVEGADDGNTVSVEGADDGNTVTVEGAEDGPKMGKILKKYRVDVLRCESLAALSPATLDRMFLRDYGIVVSMVPLPQSSILPGPKGPIHFGPPSYSSMTPWMKLVLYTVTGSGPLSVVLMKGQCLRLLPAPLAGCEKALIWSWDGSSVGGLGGKPEGNLVRGSILLHCLNSLLKFSAVLVLPLSRDDLDDKGNTVILDVPFPLKNFDGSPACIGEELGLHAEESLKLNSLLSDLANKINLCAIGYIRLLRLYNEREAESFSPNDEKYEWVLLSVEFGIPLFSPQLCKNICKRVVSSHLLQIDLLEEHHDAMQDLRRKLRDVCAEYQATGSTARLLYQKEQPKETSRKSLVTYASGKWNPLVGPSSPISGASSEHQRFKLANRQRSGTEVLSFDGHILRSYALSPIYEEDATRAMEESLPVGSGKVDSDEVDSREVVLPGVNLLFDGTELRPFEIGACLQARQPVSLIAEASAASLGSAVK